MNKLTLVQKTALEMGFKQCQEPVSGIPPSDTWFFHPDLPGNIFLPPLATMENLFLAIVQAGQAKKCVEIQKALNINVL